MEVRVDAIGTAVGDLLRNMVLLPTYPSEEKDLHPHIAKELASMFAREFPNGDFAITLSTGGKNRPHLNLLGTNFWVDVEIREGKHKLVAIEAKVVRKGASGPIAEAIGQAVVYSCVYPKVFIFVAHSGLHNPKLIEHDEELVERLLPLNVELIVRRIRDPLSSA